jgi:hypothetical protein
MKIKHLAKIRGSRQKPRVGAVLANRLPRRLGLFEQTRIAG